MKKINAFTFVLVLAISLITYGCSGDTRDRSTITPLPSVTDTAPPPASLTPPGKVETPPTAVDENAAPTEDALGISVDITATNSYVLNVDSNSIIYQKSSDEHIAPASTAKMLTALTVLEICSPDDMFTVGSEIDLIASDSSTAWLNHGDKLTVKQLLVALLVPSGNDAAYVLAVNAGRKIAGDDNLATGQAIKAFMGAMNKKAKEVGATSSNFVTPDGYDAQGQYTTAFDLAQIAKECLRHDVLLKIMGSYKINDTWANGREVTYLNTNELIDPNSQYYYSGATGLKTGNSGSSGSCLVSAAVINGTTYICVVMGASAETRFSDSLTIWAEIDEALIVSPPITNPSVAPGGLEREKRQ
ncbi:MAG: D-alanyl-D-alanine carboxypeptidase [Oscillospiraceae bacterium]|jgi:D-alanyl-D-alanine carboxypeptidase (penicillin-binding protein 5/6)|nr:D-alanyl-D-alanine carboxypeptidase [Oscillospiraceae bacterium]